MKKQRGAMMAALRKRRIHKFLSMVIEAHTLGKSVDKKKLIALASFRWGLARRTSVDYIDTLINADLVLEQDGLIYPTELGKEECILPNNYELSNQEREVLDGTTSE